MIRPPSAAICGGGRVFLNLRRPAELSAGRRITNDDEGNKLNNITRNAYILYYANRALSTHFAYVLLNYFYDFQREITRNANRKGVHAKDVCRGIGRFRIVLCGIRTGLSRTRSENADKNMQAAFCRFRLSARLERRLTKQKRRARRNFAAGAF